MDSYIFVSSVKIKEIKEKLFADNVTLLYFGNFLKNCPVAKIKNAGLSGHVCSAKSVLMLMIFFFFFFFLI